MPAPTLPLTPRHNRYSIPQPEICKQDYWDLGRILKIDISLYELVLLKRLLVERSVQSSTPLSETDSLDDIRTTLPFETLNIQHPVSEQLVQKIDAALSRFHAEPDY
jgi:hypothetical protein